MHAREAPYGTWRSPVGSDAVARDVGWMQSLVVADGDAVYWLEARPLEDGREAVVRWRDGVRRRRGAALGERAHAGA